MRKQNLIPPNHQKSDMLFLTPNPRFMGATGCFLLRFVLGPFLCWVRQPATVTKILRRPAREEDEEEIEDDYEDDK